MRSTELCELFEKYGSDKCPHYFHTYSQHYFDLFNPIKNDIKTFVEIGVGSFELMAGRIVPKDKYQPGASLRAWNDFFPNANIYGLDINTVDFFEFDRVRCLWTDQSNSIELEKTLNHILNLEGGQYVDVILDDGSHIVDHQILSIKTLKKYLKVGGIYIIEDIKDVDFTIFENLDIGEMELIMIHKEHTTKSPGQNSFVVFKKIDKIDLNTERMSGRGDYIREGHKVNKLFGLDDFCKKYVNKESKLLELGCNDGISTRLFCYYSNNVVGVDCIKTKKIIELMDSTDNFTIHNMSFEDFFKINKEKFDIIYIDGGHDFDSIFNDIKNSLFILNSGGVISGHDFYETTGVPRAVRHFFKDGDIEIFSDSTWSVKIPKNDITKIWI